MRVMVVKFIPHEVIHSYGSTECIVTVVHVYDVSRWRYEGSLKTFGSSLVYVFRK